MPHRPRARRLLGALGLPLLLAPLLLGCAEPDSRADPRGGVPEDAPVVLTTFTVLADIARNVAGDRIRVESITKAGAEIHGYEPTPLDIAKAAEAALILDNGFGLEAWFAQFVAQVEVPHVVVTEGIAPIDIAEDAYAGKPNPHAWMSPALVQRYVDNIVAAFSELEPEHAEEFAANGAAYRSELQEVQDELEAALAELPEPQRALVSCEGAFPYLARDAGLAEQYIWPVNAEQQATPRQIADTIEFVQEHDVPAVFCESTVSDRAMRQVVEATGARFGGTLYVDSLSEADGPVQSYLDLIRYDAETIASALTGSGS
ncbi:metal ABC transporter substrate-binding protein [Leucobacter allii]|uniref:Metal ABC transporter substrate-binding protein n=1 Tax=Leucobacter allii TaxID=2932247 RepID=A0ABY4FQ55_9MICO|nr:metal ABC transporter substrate-binding protein [Leucobacter allii]UOQ58414.1 metal ABC transporter substrate-binding protein [Leucobacter allii]